MKYPTSFHKKLNYYLVINTNKEFFKFKPLSYIDKFAKKVVDSKCN